MTHRAGLWLVSFPQAGAVSLQGHDETRALICRDDARKTTARPAKWKGLAFASDHPDAMPQAIKLIDAKGRSCIAPFPDSSGVLCAINASNSTSVAAGCRLHSPIKMTIDRIKALIDELRTQKLNFAPSGNRKAVPGGCLFHQVRRSTRASLTEAAPASPARLTSRNSVLPSGTARCGSSEKPTLDSVRKLWPLAKSSGH
jgi:hypothetical protein